DRVAARSSHRIAVRTRRTRWPKFRRPERHRSSKRLEGWAARRLFRSGEPVLREIRVGLKKIQSADQRTTIRVLQEYGAVKDRRPEHRQAKAGAGYQRSGAPFLRGWEANIAETIRSTRSGRPLSLVQGY